MAEQINPILDLDDFMGSIVFEKKEDASETSENLTLEEKMVNYSNEVLGIKVMSVAIPQNYNPELRSESQLIEWLQDKVKNKHIAGHILATKYGERPKIKLEKKEPYINN